MQIFKAPKDSEEVIVRRVLRRLDRYFAQHAVKGNTPPVKVTPNVTAPVDVAKEDFAPRPFVIPVRPVVPEIVPVPPKISLAPPLPPTPVPPRREELSSTASVRADEIPSAIEPRPEEPVSSSFSAQPVVKPLRTETKATPAPKEPALRNPAPQDPAHKILAAVQAAGSPASSQKDAPTAPLKAAKKVVEKQPQDIVQKAPPDYRQVEIASAPMGSGREDSALDPSMFASLKPERQTVLGMRPGFLVALILTLIIFAVLWFFMNEDSLQY